MSDHECRADQEGRGAMIEHATYTSATAAQKISVTNALADFCALDTLPFQVVNLESLFNLVFDKHIGYNVTGSNRYTRLSMESLGKVLSAVRT